MIVTLTDATSGHPVYINLHKIELIHEVFNGGGVYHCTAVHVGRHFRNVRERADAVLEKIQNASSKYKPVY